MQFIEVYLIFFYKLCLVCKLQSDFQHKLLLDLLFWLTLCPPVTPKSAFLGWYLCECCWWPCSAFRIKAGLSRISFLNIDLAGKTCEQLTGLVVNLKATAGQNEQWIKKIDVIMFFSQQISWKYCETFTLFNNSSQESVWILKMLLKSYNWNWWGSKDLWCK